MVYTDEFLANFKTHIFLFCWIYMFDAGSHKPFKIKNKKVSSKRKEFAPRTSSVFTKKTMCSV